MPFSKCLRAKIYSNLNVYFGPKGCQSLLLKESDPLLFSLGSWTIDKIWTASDENALPLAALLTQSKKTKNSEKNDGQVLAGSKHLLQTPAY